MFNKALASEKFTLNRKHNVFISRIFFISLKRKQEHSFYHTAIPFFAEKEIGYLKKRYTRAEIVTDGLFKFTFRPSDPDWVG